MIPHPSGLTVNMSACASTSCDAAMSMSALQMCELSTTKSGPTKPPASISSGKLAASRSHTATASPSASVMFMNLVERNHDAGIFHEISFNAVIRNKVVRHNGLGESRLFPDAHLPAVM